MPQDRIAHGALLCLFLAAAFIAPIHLVGAQRGAPPPSAPQRNWSPWEHPGGAPQIRFRMACDAHNPTTGRSRWYVEIRNDYTVYSDLDFSIADVSYSLKDLRPGQPVSINIDLSKPACGVELPTFSVSRLGSGVPTKLRPGVPRIQLGSYTNPDLGIFNDPLTEIVKIGANWGTGTFLPECRVLTALHVLTSMKHNERTWRLKPGESLVGQSFWFETQPVPGTGKRVRGSMVVLGHGALEGANHESDATEDWAVGYDSECLSDKHMLGVVRLLPRQSLSVMKRREFFTAGHSVFDAAKKDGLYHLYVDSSCGVVDDPRVNDDHNANFIVTNCSVTGGGSGQLLLRVPVVNGEVRMGSHGRAQKLGHGIFQAEAPHDVGVPNNLPASGISIMSDDFYLGKLADFLTGPVKK